MKQTKLTVSLFVVVSIDGYIARNIEDTPFQWNSREDQDHFLQSTREIGVLIMGNRTYKSMGGKVRSGLEYYVFSHSEEQNSSNLNYVKGDSKEVLVSLEKNGVTRVALIGGNEVYTQFLQAGLVDTMFVTIEPVVFGSGIPFISGLNMPIRWELVTSSLLNATGTLLLEYDLRE
ncbi:MAG: dihydrofolate reductase family protein [Candidatus Dojkabacteria bacterium]